jgi:hypothetical protein
MTKEEPQLLISLSSSIRGAGLTNSETKPEIYQLMKRRKELRGIEIDKRISKTPIHEA